MFGELMCFFIGACSPGVKSKITKFKGYGTNQQRAKNTKLLSAVLAFSQWNPHVIYFHKGLVNRGFNVLFVVGLSNLLKNR